LRLYRDAPTGTDPLIALGAEQLRIFARLNDPGQFPDDLTAADCAELNAIEDQIKALVPISLAGAVVLVRFLQHQMQVFEWGETADQISDNLIAGLERLGEGGAV
jgi:hypothetical protein